MSVATISMVKTLSISRSEAFSLSGNGSIAFSQKEMKVIANHA
jgi:hypothetical protein